MEATVSHRSVLETGGRIRPRTRESDAPARRAEDAAARALRKIGRSVLAVGLLASAGVGLTPAAEPRPLEPLDLAALLVEAAESNPAILALQARRRAAEHVPSQMRALPDPTVSVAYTNETFTDLTLGSTPDSSLVFAWTQEVPYPGKRRLSEDVGRAGIDVVARALDATRLRVAAEVKTTYARLFRLDRTASILGENRELLRSYLGAARARYETGEGILENVLKAQTELTKIEADLAAVAQERRSAGVALNAALGREADTPLGSASVLPVATLPDRDSMERAALELSPDLLGLQAAARSEEARLDLARRELKPDFMWGTSYMNRGGLDPMVTGMFGVRLPLYRKKKQAEAVVQTEHELEAARWDVDWRRVQVLSEVRDLHARAERAETLQRFYLEGVLPQARGALDSAAASYAVGQAEFITLLDDFLTVLSYEVEYEVQREEALQALAALEPLTGAVLVQPGAAEQAPESAGRIP